MQLPPARVIGYRVKAGLGGAMFSTLVGGMIGSVCGLPYHNTYIEWTFAGFTALMMIIVSWNDKVPESD